MAEVSETIRELSAYLARLAVASPVGKIVKALISPLLKGRLVYYTGWDDLRAPATGINPPGAASDPTVGEDGSLRFSATSENLIAVLMQMPHAWKEGSTIRPHLHWSKTTDAAGNVIWEERHRVLPLGSPPPAWSAWAPANARSAEPGSTQNQTMDFFPEIEMTGHPISTMISFQIRRNPAAAGDDYAALAALWEFDVHYQKDAIGSFSPGDKGEV